jgi:regulator of replication initiation timing
VNFSEFATIEKIRKSAAAIRQQQRELAKQEKALAENHKLAERLGLEKNAEAEAAVNSMRARIAEMKATHNKFVHEKGLGLELFPE